MNRRDELRRNGAVAALSLLGAVVLWLIFHSVYENLSVSEQAVGYVDPTTQSGIYFGYFAMLAGIVALAAIALWAAIKCVLLLARRS
ncbi:MAG TPA: hypothetical protein VHR97_04220 [Candidatus Baltobacteraceae bacterium]|jgi:hypothetical protein|nr:hypothetical protein [Candidatus Baltobacteraceae bacterium]